MKPILNLFFAFAAIPIFIACNKDKNNYSSGSDHAMGMTNSRHWKGTADGYYPIDTVVDTKHTSWPHYYNRSIDTIFSLLRVDDFDINALGTLFHYRSTDSLKGIVVFDTTIPGSAKSIVTYYYLHDSITYEYYRIDSTHVPSGKYYQANETLHTYKD